MRKKFNIDEKSKYKVTHELHSSSDCLPSIFHASDASDEPLSLIRHRWRS